MNRSHVDGRRQRNLLMNSRQRSTVRCLHWYPAILSVSFMVVSCSVIYISAIMRRTSTSSERFEGIPCYILAVHFLICAGVMMLLSQRPREGEWQLVIRFGAAVLGTALLLAVAAMTMTLWHAEQQNRLHFCVYHPTAKRCACRNHNSTELGVSTGKWTFYENIDSCRSLDRIFLCMVAVTSVYALSGFLCFLAITHMCMLWQQNSTARRYNMHAAAVRPPNSHLIQEQSPDHLLLRILGDLRVYGAPPPSYSQANVATIASGPLHVPPPAYESREPSPPPVPITSYGQDSSIKPYSETGRSPSRNSI